MLIFQVLQLTVYFQYVFSALNVNFLLEAMHKARSRQLAQVLYGLQHAKREIRIFA